MMWNIPIYTKITIFWDVMQWSFDTYHRFQGTCCLELQERFVMMQVQVHSKCMLNDMAPQPKIF